MDRAQVVQSMLDLFPSPDYLEVGVSHGTTFHALAAARKTAVDPQFKFSVPDALALPGNGGSAYHEVPSDRYFAAVHEPGRLFDVIYLDGLHTFDQTLRDLLHAIAVLKPNGVIVIDDVMPSSYAAAIPDWDESIRFRGLVGDPDASWMGDVYKLVFFVRDYLTDWSYASVVENHGQTVLWRETRPEPAAPLSVARIAALDYSDVVFDKAALAFRPFADILAAVRSAVS